MQTKKRAKPVKFNKKEEVSKDNTKPKEEDVKTSEEPVEPKSSQDNSEPESEDKGAKIHYSKSIETIDVTESFDDPVETAELKDEASDNNTEREKEESKVVAKPLTDDTEASSEASGEEEPVTPPVEQDGAFFNAPPDAYENKKSSFPYFLKVMVVTFLFGVVFFAGIYYAVSNKSLKSILPTTHKSEVAKVSVTKSPTPTPVDLSKYTIQILNGTTTTGIAGKLKTQLTDAGFNVLSVGNATDTSFTTTQIAAKKTVENAYLDKLEQELKKSYSLGSTTELATGAADVVVTIGNTTTK